MTDAERLMYDEFKAAVDLRIQSDGWHARCPCGDTLSRASSSLAGRWLSLHRDHVEGAK